MQRSYVVAVFASITGMAFGMHAASAQDETTPSGYQFFVTPYLWLASVHATTLTPLRAAVLRVRVRCEPVSRGNSPFYVEKPRFSAGARAGASGRVGRDAQDAATSGLRAVISLSGHIPVPHRR